MKKGFFICIIVFLLISLTFNEAGLAYINESSLDKGSFLSADDFYNNYVDKRDYEEFMGSNLNVRKRMMVKDLPKIFDEKLWNNYPYAWKKHLKKAIIGNTKELKLDQQVYYFFSVKDDADKIHIKFAMYDVTNQSLRSQGGGHWTKEEFKRKFE